MKHDNSLKDFEQIEGVRVVRAKTIFKISKGYISFDWLIKSWQEVRKNDVIIINLPQAEGIITAIFAKLMRKKLISIYHARVVLRGGIVDKIIERLLEIINISVMQMSDRVIVYTDDYARSLTFYNKIKNKYIAIYPPIRIPGTNKKIIESIRKRIPKGVKIVVGMVARLAEDKGFEYIIEALPILEQHFGKGEVIIAVLGSTEPVGEVMYRNKITKLISNGLNNFVLLGVIDNKYIGSFYEQIDVLIVPSILESFGIVQVEAMMMGVPVVTSDLPGARVPINITGMGYLVAPRDPIALAEKIINAFDNKEAILKRKGFARSEFNISKTIGYYHRLFEKL